LKVGFSATSKSSFSKHRLRELSLDFDRGR
jgi:hypothetical protein